MYNYLSQNTCGIEIVDNNEYPYDEWYTEYRNVDGGEMPQLRGYWTSTPMHPEPTQTGANLYKNFVWYVGKASVNTASVNLYKPTDGYKDIGIRPVIEVPKYFFE